MGDWTTPERPIDQPEDKLSGEAVENISGLYDYLDMFITDYAANKIDDKGLEEYVDMIGDKLDTLDADVGDMAEYQEIIDLLKEKNLKGALALIESLRGDLLSLADADGFKLEKSEEKVEAATDTTVYKLDISEVRANFYQGTLYEKGKWVRQYPSKFAEASNLMEAYDKLESKFRLEEGVKIEPNQYVMLPNGQVVPRKVKEKKPEYAE